MSSTVATTTAAVTAAAPLRCLLAASGSYREQLTLTPLDGQPGRYDLRVTSWLESARDPLLAHHTRLRTTLDRAALQRLHQALGALLENEDGAQNTADTGSAA